MFSKGLMLESAFNRTGRAASRLVITGDPDRFGFAASTQRSMMRGLTAKEQERLSAILSDLVASGAPEAALSVRLFIELHILRRRVLELRQRVAEDQFHIPNGTIAMLRHPEVHGVKVRLFLCLLRSPEHEYHVGILLNGAGFA